MERCRYCHAIYDSERTLHYAPDRAERFDEQTMARHEAFCKCATCTAFTGQSCRAGGPEDFFTVACPRHVDDAAKLARLRSTRTTQELP